MHLFKVSIISVILKLCSVATSSSTPVEMYVLVFASTNSFTCFLSFLPSLYVPLVVYRLWVAVLLLVLLVTYKDMMVSFITANIKYKTARKCYYDNITEIVCLLATTTSV